MPPATALSAARRRLRRGVAAAGVAALAAAASVTVATSPAATAGGPVDRRPAPSGAGEAVWPGPGSWAGDHPLAAEPPAQVEANVPPAATEPVPAPAAGAAPAATTTAPAATTTAPAATLTPATAAPVTAPAAPAPPVTAPPAPAPTADPGILDLAGRTVAALESAVPAAWRADLAVGIVLLPGTLSLSNIDGTLKISAVAAAGAWGTLRFVVVHEWAHQVAFHYGTQAFAGAPPEGFPYAGEHPQEVWADCVARGLTGVSLGTNGLYPECDADLAGWARAWLGDGPSGRARTR